MTNTENPNPPRSAAGRLANRWNTPLRRAVALSALGVAAVTLAACGSSSSASTTSTTKAPASAGGGSGGAGAGGGARPGASGTIAAITGASLEVQNPTTGQTTVNYTSSTAFDQTVPATASSVTLGACISAFGTPTTASSSSTPTFGRPVTATTVSVSQPTSGSCTGGFGGRGFGGGTGRPPGGGFPGGRRPTTGAGGAGRFSGQFGAASGPVTAINGSAVTVNETNPTTKKVSSVVVTLTSTTVFTERQSAAATDLAVGKCATAVGTADSTGAVTARSITISTPGANGCTTGFGRFGGGPGGAGGGGGTAPGGSTGA
jgi:hypothetical protein